MCGNFLNVDEVHGFPYDARAVRRPVILAGSNLAKQEQDQQNNKHNAEGAAPVVASTVKGPPPIPLRPPNNAITKMMRMMVPTDILESPYAGSPKSLRGLNRRN
jgi:hypothetical protein